MRRLGIVALVVLFGACTSAAPRMSGPPTSPGTPSPSASSPAPKPQASPTKSPTTNAPPAQARFEGSVSPIDASTRARMRYSWRSGCPVPLDELRLLRLRFWGFDGRVQRGELVVNRDVASSVLVTFRRSFDARFPIQQMVLVDVYRGDDDRSMAANNTSGFNCRRSVGNPDRWSEHSYGRAIDINPVQNPYVDGSDVKPPAGRAYADRSKRARGMIHPGDVVVRAFSSIGWTWGGTYRSVKDYQHFSRDGT